MRCVLLPVPAEAIITVPGLALASAINSCAFLTGNEGCVTSTSGTMDTVEVGAKSLIGSYACTVENAGFTVSEPLDPSNRV